MTKYLLILPLCLLLLSHALPVCADQYDDCLAGCGQPLASCIKKAKLTAGNIQEEHDLIAACNKNKADCIQGCKDAEASSNTPPHPQAQPPREKPPVDFNGEIKTYKFK